MSQTMSTPTESHQLTLFLQRAQAGDRDAVSGLVPLVYRELHALAERSMRHERPNHTLQATVLVHEAYLQLVSAGKIDWQGRTHFFALASNTMRRVLVDHARAARADKRPGGHQQVELNSRIGITEQSIDVIALNDALDELAVFDKRQADIVEMRFFAGLSFEEIAEVLNISVRTAKRDWAMARAWLHNELDGGGHNAA